MPFDTYFDQIIHILNVAQAIASLIRKRGQRK